MQLLHLFLNIGCINATCCIYLLGQIKSKGLRSTYSNELRGSFSYLLGMGTKELLREIERLPVSKRILVIEQTLKSIRQAELKARIDKAVNTLMHGYRSDKELTTFTDIDFENFYETR